MRHRLALVLIFSLGYSALADDKPAPESKKPARTDLYGDPLPPGALARMGTVQLRQLTGGVGTAFSPDSTVLATTDGNSLRLWSMASGKLLLQVKDDHEWWGPVLFSPDGKLLASACTGSLYLLNPATGKLVRRIPAVDRVLAFSPDSKLVATNTNDPKQPASVLLWHATTGQRAFQLRRSEQYLYSAVFTPDGRTLVTMCSSQQQRFDKIICHWDVATGALRKTVVLHLPHVRFSHTLCLSPDGQTVAFAVTRLSEAVGLWDTSTGKQRTTLEGDLAAARDLAFTRDSRTLATAWAEDYAAQGTISLWDAATGKRLRRFPIPERAAGSLQFAPDGRTLATNNAGPRVYLWDTATGQPRWQREAHDGYWISLAFTPDGQTLVSGCNDGTIRVWDAATGRQLRELPGHRWNVGTVAVLPDGQTLLSSGGDGVIRLQDLTTGKQLRRFVIDQEPEKLTEPGCHISSLGLAADGRTAASFSYRDGSPLFHVWDLATGKAFIRPGNKSEINFGSFSPDAKLILRYVDSNVEITKATNVIVLEEVATGRQVLTLHLPDKPGGGCHAFSPDGQTLATVTARVIWDEWDEAYYVDRHAIRLWELATGKERLTVMTDKAGADFTHDYGQLAFAPDGRTFATARGDHTLQLWDVATGQELLRRTGYEADISALAIAPDGRTLASGHEDSTILLWDLAPETWRRQRPSRLLEIQELEAAWADLASPDARKAHAAIWRLVAVPRHAVPLLRERLRPVPPVPADRLRQLLKDLDGSQFRQREAAGQQLAELEEQVEPALQDALKGNPSAEQRRRIESLLTGPRVVRSSEKVRALRAVQVLEQCNLPEAKQVLQTLATGAPEARLTQEAKASLERLAKRTDPAR
jgi:WD40 repeat protein